MFTVVIQKGWKLMAKKKEQKTPKKKEKIISILSAKTVSTGGCRHCCHGYKITNTYEGLHSSHRHLKKHGLFSGRLKYKQFEGRGDTTLLGGHCGVMGEDMHNSAVWKNVKQRKEPQKTTG